MESGKFELRVRVLPFKTLFDLSPYDFRFSKHRRANKEKISFRSFISNLLKLGKV